MNRNKSNKQNSKTQTEKPVDRTTNNRNGQGTFRLHPIFSSMFRSMFPNAYGGTR